MSVCADSDRPDDGNLRQPLTPLKECRRNSKESNGSRLSKESNGSSKENNGMELYNMHGAVEGVKGSVDACVQAKKTIPVQLVTTSMTRT